MRKFCSYSQHVTILMVALIIAPARADPVDNLVTFSAGTTARASEVNGNFTEVANSVNDNDARIAALEAEIAALRAELNNVLNVNQYLSLETVNGQPTIRVTAANLQVVNGMDATASANGTGNIIIGYAEERTEGEEHCSIGYKLQTSIALHRPDTEEECLDSVVNGVWALSHKSGSHYLIVGAEHSWSRWGGIVVGERNTSNSEFASVTGGSANMASAPSASISAGTGNLAHGLASGVSGGFDNRTSAPNSSISGGLRNTASGIYSSVSGGSRNIASESFSSVTGGNENVASGRSSTVSGGRRNTAGASFASVSGGEGNTAGIATTEGVASSISGGIGNDAVGYGSSVSGGFSGVVRGEYDWRAGGLTQDL